MKPNRGALRRCLALAAAALIGAAVAVAAAAPASAHHPIVTGNATCDADTGTWRVTWTVANSERDIEGTLTKVNLTPSDSTVTNIAVGSHLPVATAAPLTGVQVLPATATSAGLEVTAQWHRPYREIVQSAAASVLFQGTCTIPTEPRPAATFASHCDGSVTTTLLNGEDATATATFVVSADGGFTQRTTVQPGGSVDVVVPAANAGKITVTSGRRTVATGGAQDPADCAVAEKTVAQTCDSISVSVANPDSGRIVTGQLTPSTGDRVSFTLQPGESKSASFLGTDGLTVLLAVTGLDEETVTWAKPASCEPPLPNTGSNLTATISMGATLVVLGAGILYFFRRRRSAHARY